MTTNETKHTPGPWTIQQPSVMHGVQILRHYDIPAISEVVCSNVKGKANARLIAAAPDMLEALRAVIECFPYAVALAAIAKAEGRG